MEEEEIVTPPQFKRWTELKLLRRTENRGGLTCQLSLNDNDNQVITITFEGVNELRIHDLDSDTLLGPIKIIDIRDRQLEIAKYKAMDYEEERLSLLCTSFDIKG